MNTRAALFGDPLLASITVPADARLWRKLVAFAGPGWLIAVGYMDPGNWATDIAGGSRFGYGLLSVILVSNLVAVFLQHQALKLGIASGRDLAQACRERLGPMVSMFLWLGAEVAIVACDLAEVIGTAIALKLLFHIPLLWGVAATVLDSLVVLGLMGRGFRYVEAFISSLILVVGGCLVLELMMARPSAAGILHALIPGQAVIHGQGALYLALGIFGATVMPHNLYLHSSIAQTRDFARSERGRREAVRFTGLDSLISLVVATLINAALLILAAAAFHTSGHREIASLEDAYRLLSPLLGTAVASALFGLALLASGQNSTVTGTLAGQIVMEGFLGLRINPALRRLLTRGLAAAPAFLITAIAGESATVRLLILSQVVLSVQLGFAVLPLVLFTGDRRLMGSLVNPKWVTGVGLALTAAILAVNALLVVQALA